MAAAEWIYALDVSVVTCGFLLALIAAARLGFFLGRRAGEKTPGAVRTQVQALEAGMLTLLALLLAFTFSMAAGRYEARRDALVEEANAIGTAYLRTSTLPEVLAKQLQAELRQYVDLRLEVYQSPPADPDLATLASKAGALQRTIWSAAAQEAKLNPTPVNAGVLSALNAVIDASEKQTAVYETHVPESILGFLLVLSTLTLGIVGYLNGLSQNNLRILTVLFAGMIAMTTFLVMDLDRPRRGIIRIGHGSMLRLKEDLRR